MVMVMLDLIHIHAVADTCTTTAGQKSLLALAKLTTRLVPPQVVQSGKSPLATQAVKLTQHVLMFWSMRGHVPFEVAPFAVQVLTADVTVHLVALVAGRDVVVTDLFVHEALGAAGERTFEGTTFVGGGSGSSVGPGGCSRRGNVRGGGR